MTRKRSIPYGLACIAAALLKAEFSVEIIDALATGKTRNIALPEPMTYLLPIYGRHDRSPFGLFHQYKHFGYSYEHLAGLVAESGAWLVGISSLFSAYSDEALITAVAVKKAAPNCKIVLGGHHPTVLPESAISNPAVDFVLRGDGEIAMPRLASVLKSGGDIGTVPGICYRDSGGQVHISAPAVLADLDAAPIPAISLTNGRYYRRRKKTSAVVTASRGCPLACSYCAVGAGSDYPYRRRTVSAVMSELEVLFDNHDVGFIDFEDENISLDSRWFLELLTIITKRYGSRNIELRAMNGLFPPSLNRKVIAAMKAAGFKTLNLSLGTICPEQSRRFKRPDVRPAFEKVITIVQEMGMDAVGYMITGAPDQTAETSLADLIYLAGQRVLIGTSIYYPAPGSMDYHRCLELGLLPGSFSLMRSSVFPIAHKIDRISAATLLRLSRIVNFIKHLIDRGIAIPTPTKCDKHTIPMENREEAGGHLLSWFLHDGRIRGVEPSGKIFDHKIDQELTISFVGKLKKKDIRGVASAISRRLP